ncbi:glycosyl transferase family 8 [Cohnella kolymensis]|uniref:Glycosyl transferase family 8 n=1 Tax=Cohnella kolymensis TaxID=1590652 RepID=A0ABR5A2Y2_9BACL|nr:glycosyltransferase family 8 protein [Cohnella kolymensis]KIL35400.1 glycosyl transferase family 8 [Cohnella kolymensis]
MTLSVVYSSDNNYAQHVGVSMLSLFENNKHFGIIQVYLIENHISSDNKQQLNSICRNYGRSIKYIDFGEFSDKLKLNIGNSISINSYARLFLSSVLHVDKVIYLDCDSIINESLSELWDTDISNYHAAGVCDTVSDDTKLRIKLGANHSYINAGMLLINLKKWRESDIENQFLEFIRSYSGKVFHHDQGTINGVLYDKILLLHPKFNAMTTIFTMTREEMMRYYGMKSYYSDAELKQAAIRPVFVHFTPAFVNRPWIKGSKHPLVSLYKHYLNMSPWKDADLWNDSRGQAEKIIAFLYNHLPFRMADGICKLISR